MLRYSQHAATATGLQAETIAKHFKEHADDEWAHARILGERIHQLGGTPSLEPTNLADRAHSSYVECETLAEMIQENLVAERVAVIFYTELVRYIGDGDPTTCRLVEGILAKEEEHADELASLLDSFDPREPMH